MFAAGVASAQDYLITDFGAKGDNSTNNTAAIQKAINKAAIKGGTVVVPPGIFVTGTIVLKSNTTLQINKNATIKGIASREAYPSVPLNYTAFTGLGQSAHTLIYATGAENVSIKGEGTIDGNGADPIFYFTERKKMPEVMRPYVILITGCKNVNVSGVTMKNSAMWMQHYLACDFLRITGITVFNHANPNNDGLDIGDCHNVIVSDCIIDADDDALCFKSEGARGVRNVVVTNCILSSHASAFKLGTGSVSGFQSIQFANSVIRPSLATNLVHVLQQKGGLTGIDMASTDGALLKDINIMNVSIDSVENPIFIKLGNRLAGGKTKGRVGVAEGIHLSQITIKNAGLVPSAITGFPGNYVNDVSLRDIFIEHRGGGTEKDTTLKVPEQSDVYPGEKMFKGKLPASGFYVRHVKNIQFSNIQLKMLNNDARPALVFDDVEELTIYGFRYKPVSTASAPIVLTSTQKADLHFSVFDAHPLKVQNSADVFVNGKPFINPK